jgi:aryl-alcohol dehydrogenase-like predicted oxidoreductase
METRRIGSLEVSLVGLGCNNFGGRLDAAQSTAVIHAALDTGVTLLDTADVYGGTRSEEIIGDALVGRRERVVLATKFGMPLPDGSGGAKPAGASPAYVRKAVEDSLRRLKTDRIDLYQLHRPDPGTPIGETLAALDELVRAGKVREIGCSNFSAAQLGEAAAAARPGAARFVRVQNEYSLLARDAEREVLPAASASGLAFLPYFPLASGLLSGKYKKGQPAPAGTRLAATDGRLSGRFLNDGNLARAEALAAFARAQGHTLLELAFSWLVARSAVSSVIAGATSPEQVRANVAAPSWKLSADELARIDEILQPAT